MGSGYVESIFGGYILYIWPDSEPTKLFSYPKQKPRRGGGLRQINNCCQIQLQVKFCKKRRPLGFGDFIVFWSMLWGSAAWKYPANWQHQPVQCRRARARNRQDGADSWRARRMRAPDCRRCSARRRQLCCTCLARPGCCSIRSSGKFNFSVFA